MKILLLAELVSVLKDMHYHDYAFGDAITVLPSEKTFRIFTESSSIALYVITYTEFISFQDFSSPLNSTLWDDYRLTIQTRYRTFNDIVRERSDDLFKARNSFPLIQQELLSVDELEAMEFQLLTKYTQNEVNSMILHHVYASSTDDMHPRVIVDFNMYDLLSEDDLKNLIQLLKEFLCKTVQSS